MREGRMRAGGWRRRGRRVVNLAFNGLHGGVNIEDGDLLTGILDLRRALARGLRRPPSPAVGRRPPMIGAEAPAGPPPPSAISAPYGRVLGMGTVDFVAGPSFRLRYRSTEIHLPAEWVWGYLDKWIETLGTIPAYRSRGPVSGTGHVMDMFWPRLRARTLTLPDRGAYSRLIGCWMVPVDAAEGMPESLFFRSAGGAMRAVHALTCQVLHAYADEAAVPRSTDAPYAKLVTDDGWCNQLGDFIKAMCMGTDIDALDGNQLRPTPRSEGPCGRVIINYADNHEESLRGRQPIGRPCAGIGEWPSENHWCWQVYSDSTAFSGADVLPWDAYALGVIATPYREGRGPGSIVGPIAGLVGPSAGLVGPSAGFVGPYAGLEYVTFTDLDNPASTLKPWPRSDTTFSTARASSSRRAVTFQPAHLAYDGEVCDTLMFMAQLCLDRARALCSRREREAPDWAPQAVLAVRAGRQFASYALVIIAERAKVLVHELGHVYLGGSPHCGYDASILSKEVASPVAEHTGAPRWRSCFDVASWAFLARVQAENGLPIEPYIAEGAAGRAPSSQRSPDFGGHPGSTTREIEELNRPFWVPGRAGGDCTSVPVGAEYINAEVERRMRRPAGATVCVGRARWELSALGESGGGFSFFTTNGCACEVPSVATSGAGGSVLSGYEPGSSIAACPDASAYRRGGHVVTDT
jgi:hypothetical protein